MGAITTGEEALRKSKELLEQTQRITKVGGWEYDVSSLMVSWTEEVYRIYEVSAGFDPSDIRMALDFYSPQDRPLIEGAFRRAVEEGVPYDMELQFTGASGTRKWVRTTAEVERVSGKITRVFGNIMDITARKESESHVRYLASIVQSSDDAIIGKTLDGVVTSWNRGAEKLYGFTEEEMIGRSLSIIIPSDLKDEAAGILERIGKGERVEHKETVRLRKDGERIPVLLTVSPIADPSGRILGASTIAKDITDLKRAEEALRRNQDLLLQFVRNSPIYAFIKEVTPNESRVLYASDNFEQMVGIPGRDMPGKTMTELFPAEFAAKIAADDWAVVEKGRVLKLDEDWNGRNYTTIKYPILQGEKTLLAGYTIDITDSKKAEEEKHDLERQVQQKQKLESLGVLAGGIAHDFNNLLMVVLGHAELALKEISPNSPARENLDEITTAARRAADLSVRMLQYVGKAPFVLERVGLRELVEEMADLLKSTISKKATLTLNMGRGLPPIEADPSQIRQLVTNLVMNASEAIGDRSGTITVSADATWCCEDFLRKTEPRDNLAPGLYVRLEVKDTGIGMDALTRSRIFDPFFSTKFIGRGLGLAAVLGIVRSHKGALHVSSEPGIGTTFLVLFPALTEDGDASRSPSPSRSSDGRGKGTVLLVDDEESLLALGTRMLEHLGFNVLVARNGLEAVDLYRRQGKGIDLVLMDLTMPEMDGAEALDELRRLDPDVRVILASGYAREEVLPRFEGKCIEGVLQKPYTFANLRESLAGSMPERHL